ncbi:N-acetylglucosamine-6-phosphate deacetylase [Thalassotalea maritima]|uniref:N-acetylglucosamine-6-phosphate deacetylase n=1 Tax=Thalassotalea maritima TaxID=3242416 RepID=UPI0035270F60
MKTTYIVDSLFTGIEWLTNQAITVEDGHILNFEPCKNSKEIKLHGKLTAGFIDIQTNGGGGVLFNDQPSLSTLQTMVQAHGQYGTTGLLPTLITSDSHRLQKAADSVSQAIKGNMPGVLGIHFEGPHLSVIKKGIHSERHIRSITDVELDVFCRDDLGVKILTLAPETVDVDIIRTLVEHDVLVFLGHSNANYQQAKAALDAGARGFTHVFNAMSALTSREPNMVGAALSDDNSFNGIILDGYHVDPVTARIAYKAKANGKTLLVTDAMSTIGSKQKIFEFDGHKVTLCNDKLVSHTGQLAGSALTMITAVNNAQSMLNVDLDEALNMASLYPATCLKLQSTHGQLVEGARADFTLLNSEHPSQVLGTWIAGKQIFNLGANYDKTSRIDRRTAYAI